MPTRKNSAMRGFIETTLPKSPKEDIKLNYIICETELRLSYLYQILQKNEMNRVLVVLWSNASVDFHYNLFELKDVTVTPIFEKDSGLETKLRNFYTEGGILLCTNTCAKSLNIDFKHLDWRIQYEPPESPEEYVANLKDKEASSKSLIFLREQELTFLWYAQNAGISVNDYKVPLHKLGNFNKEFFHLTSTMYIIYRTGRLAYQKYIRGYNDHKFKDVYDVKSLTIKHVAHSFAFLSPPGVNLHLSPTREPPKPKKKKPKIVKYIQPQEQFEPLL